MRPRKKLQYNLRALRERVFVQSVGSSRLEPMSEVMDNLIT